MDTSTHTVTVPISDYKKMADALEMQESGASPAMAHLEILRKANVIFYPGIITDKIPVDCRVIPGPSGVEVHFKY